MTNEAQRKSEKSLPSYHSSKSIFASNFSFCNTAGISCVSELFQSSSHDIKHLQLEFHIGSLTREVRRQVGVIDRLDAELISVSEGPGAAPRAMTGLVAFSIFGNTLVLTFTAAKVMQEIAEEGILPFSLIFAIG